MPREGGFARVLKGGAVKVGDSIEILNTCTWGTLFEM